MRTLYFCPVVSSFSSPNISSRRPDVYHTSTHANLECRYEMCCRWLAGNTGRKNDENNRHLRTISQLCWASQPRHVSTIRKKFAEQQYLLHMSPQHGKLRSTNGEICWRVWGTPANFNCFLVLAALLHGILVVGVSLSLLRWTDGDTDIRQRGHHAGHWPTF